METDLKLDSIVYNKTKLMHFKDSPFILAKYKQSDIDDIFKTITTDRKMFSAYQMCMFYRTVAETNRRKKVNKGGLDMSSILYKLKMKERHDAMQSLKTRVVLREVQRPVNLAGKDYTKLFEDTIEEDKWNDVELQVRKMFLEELGELQKNGGCSGCVRNKLIRKYIKKVQELLA